MSAPRGAPGPGVVPGQVVPPVDRMTHASENITLPQTSFAGGKNVPCGIFILHMNNESTE